MLLYTHTNQAPFCVHPKTGKVCVPIDPEAAWDFDPEEGVPTVQQLVKELAEQVRVFFAPMRECVEGSLTSRVSSTATPTHALLTPCRAAACLLPCLAPVPTAERGG